MLYTFKGLLTEPSTVVLVMLNSPYAYYTYNKKQYIIPCRHSKMKHLRYWKMDEGNLEQ